MELGIPEGTNTSLTFTLTIQFISETHVRMHDRYKGVIDGESVDEIDNDESGTYTYNSETGDVIICIETCVDGIISGNKLKFTEEGESITFTKK